MLVQMTFQLFYYKADYEQIDSSSVLDNAQEGNVQNVRLLVNAVLTILPYIRRRGLTAASAWIYCWALIWNCQASTFELFGYRAGILGHELDCWELLSSQVVQLGSWGDTESWYQSSELPT